MFAVFGIPVAIGVLVLIGFIMISLRRVVSPNEVHIVQSARKTISYGKDTPNGNVYYEWPSWVPVVGLTKTVLPVSVFSVPLNSYEAYDLGRVPFVLDLIAFFRVEDTNMAAQRVQHFKDLQDQLVSIMKGSIRTILASYDIDTIMVERAKFGQHFTDEVKEQLKNWGVVPVKNIELMDIRDAQGHEVIQNIMAKKQSLIEMQSRSEVAKNHKDARIAEINADQEAQVQEQVALQAIGQRAAQRTQEVGIADQKAKQAIAVEAAETKTKEMAVVSVETVRKAEITREAQVIAADQDKQRTVLAADAKLESQKREALGTQAVLVAQAEGNKALQLAPVQAQIVLAEKIGESEGYQRYLLGIKQIEANRDVGIENAKALTAANIKIIATSGSAPDGIKSVSDLLSSAKGGVGVGSFLEGLANTEAGKSLVDKLTGGKDPSKRAA